MKAVYISIDETTGEVRKTLIDVMLFVTLWVRTKKIPTPKSQIIEKMRKKGKSEEQIEHAINMLMKFGYIRKAQATTNRISYVQLRTISI